MKARIKNTPFEVDVVSVAFDTNKVFFGFTDSMGNVYGKTDLVFPDVDDDFEVSCK